MQRVTLQYARQNGSRNSRTAGDAKAPGFAQFTVAGGASNLELRTVGPVRLFGLTAEKPGPGVVYDSLGLNGASITVLSHTLNQQHWVAELRQRNPDLVVLNATAPTRPISRSSSTINMKRSCARPSAACVRPCPALPFW